MSSVEVGLVGQLPPDLAKVAIGNGLGQLVVFKHARHMQILDSNQGMVLDEMRGQFVGCIFPDMGYPCVLFCQLPARLLAVLAAFGTP